MFQEALSSCSTGQTLPEVNFEQEDLTIPKIYQLKQALRSLERNDALGIALLKGTTLPERVALTILQERPDLSINEVHNNAVTVTTILRTRSQRKIEQAYREAYYQDKLAGRPALDTGANDPNQLEVPPEQSDLSKLPPPKDEEYLVGDLPVVHYVMNARIPEEWATLTPHKRELKKRNMTRRAAKFEQIGGRLFRVKRPKNKPNQLPAHPKYLQVLSGP